MPNDLQNRKISDVTGVVILDTKADGHRPADAANNQKVTD